MHSPGIGPSSCRLQAIEFNEMFCENVRVPVENVSADHNGWHVAITTLMHERGTLAIAVQVRFKMLLDTLLAKAKKTIRNGRPVTEDPLIRQKLAQAHMDVEILKLNGYRSLTKMLKGEPGPEGSIGKIFWSELNQRMQELAVEILGPRRCWRRLAPRRGQRGLAAPIPPFPRQHHRGGHHRDPEEHHLRARAGDAADDLPRSGRARR
jgi:alkylation response protein AidB-like acyl-CoA dehydrogenase